MENKTHYTDIESKALWYLQRYASSSENLRKYLKRKVQNSYLNTNSDHIINSIIDSLEKQKILDDKLFSESKIRNYLNKGWSLRKIEFKLKELDVKDNIIVDCLKEAQDLDKNGIMKDQIKMMKNQMKKTNIPNQHFGRNNLRRR